MNIKTWLGIGVIAFIVIYAVGLNNSLIEKEEEVNLILDYKSMKLNDKLRFPFKIPSNFTPIKL